MCGIVGIVGHSQVAPLIVDALKRLEYRGYDSAGVATIEHGQLARRRAEGKLINLERRLKDEPLDGTIGIGHTRWATHGVPNETNAHPHFSDGVAIVHNGIIENFAELRGELIRDGYSFSSQTDTEVVAHLVARELARGLKPVEAAHQALKRLEGAFALAIMFKGDEDLIVGARNGPPLAVGHGDGEMFLGSDAIALAPFTNSITYLEDGDWAVVRRDGVAIFDIDGTKVDRKRQQSLSTSFMVDKGNRRHFMEKEIHEQPEVISHTLANYLDFVGGVSDVVLPTLAGPEIGVASTKAFTCQLSVLASLAVRAGVARGTISKEQEKTLVRALSEAPRYANQVLKLEEQIERIARELSRYKDVLYLGRDTNFPLAMEGALKLKEISYIHAEGYAAGELKHGPIALIDENMPVIVIAPHDHIFEKTVSNMQEVAARGGKIILITDSKGAALTSVKTMETIILPDVPEIISPIIYALPIQMLAYFTAVFMG
ncbi:MAG: glutamine--fructose-6-phosphate aminotransferase, partial [Mesorhizobium sp.]